MNLMDIIRTNRLIPSAELRGFLMWVNNGEPLGCVINTFLKFKGEGFDPSPFCLHLINEPLVFNIFI